MRHRMSSLSTLQSVPARSVASGKKAILSVVHVTSAPCKAGIVCSEMSAGAGIPFITMDERALSATVINSLNGNILGLVSGFCPEHLVYAFRYIHCNTGPCIVAQIPLDKLPPFWEK